MNIEEERDEIIKHVDRLEWLAQVYKAQNVEYMHMIVELTKRVECAEAMADRLAGALEELIDGFEIRDDAKLNSLVAEYRATVSKSDSVGGGE